MKKLLLIGLLANYIYAASPTIISEREWIGEYIPRPAPLLQENWSNDTKISTRATIGDAQVNKQVWGWAIFRIHVRPYYAPFLCRITKSVCMCGPLECRNVTTEIYWNNPDSLPAYDDDKSYSAPYTYTSIGVFATSSHVYMERCLGSAYDAHSDGKVTVKG